MGKISALGSNAYFGGYDLSNDITALGSISMSVNQQDTSGIDVSAMERLNLRSDGEISINAIANPSAGRSHPVLSAMPSTALGVMWASAPTAGAVAAMLMAKQANYNSAFGTDGSWQLSAQALAAVGFGVEWGQIITAGKRQDTSATATGTGIDLGVPEDAVAVDILTSSIANPTVITTDGAHGLTSGDSVLIAGHSGSTPSVNDAYTVTVTGTDTFTVDLNVTADGTGGTVIRTSTRTGWAAQRQSFSFAGTSSTVAVQHAPKNSSSLFTDLTGGAFTAATGVGSERIEGAATALLQRFVRVKTTGTFSGHTFAAGITRL